MPPTLPPTASSTATASLPEWTAPTAHARWISAPPHGGPRTVPPALHYRRAFQLSTAPRRAFVHVTALGLFELELNGQRVSDEVFAPGWTDYRQRVHYRTYDVTALLRPGENVIGAILGDGWYSGHNSERNRGYYGEQPALLLALEDHSAPDSATPAVVVATDAQWTYARGPILENDLIMGESYDARRELGAWSSPSSLVARSASDPMHSSTDAWCPVTLPAAPAIAIERSPGPPVRRHEVLPGRPISGPPDVDWLPATRRYDFGQNFTGRIRFRVRGPRGAHLRIRYAEVLNPDGSLYTDNLRSARATDHYTLRGGDTETWEPRFTFHGFRYVEFSCQRTPEPIVIEAVEGIVLHSDTPRTGRFECSHPLLNQLASNILWGQKSNFLEAPTDCPQRDERLGWTGDAQVFIRTAAFFMDVRGFFHKWLRDMRDAQSPAGAVPPVIPDIRSFGLQDDGGPAWADATFICPWTIYLCYGDLAILRDHYASMTRYLDYLAAHKVKDHIRAHPDVDGWGGFGDWLALGGATPKDLIGTAFYAHGADLTARTADLLGHFADAARYRALHADIVRAFQRRFVTTDGLLTSGTQTAYVLALHFDLLPENLRPAAARELVRLVEKNGNRIGTGFVGTPYILQVLEKHGHLDVAYRLLEQEAFPSWLFPVKNGATTIWERWDGWTPEKGFQDKGMNSFNHYAYGAVGAWMVSAVAGLELDPAEPGYRRVIFKPRPGGTLTHARAELATEHGPVSISWRLTGDQLHLDLVVPPGARATLDLPTSYGTPPTPVAAGTHSLSFRLATTAP